MASRPRPMSQLSSQSVRQFLADIASAGKDLSNGLHKFRWNAFFRQVTSGACLNCALGKLLFGMDAEKQNGDIRPNFFQVRQDVEAAGSGHTDIEDYNRPVVFLKERKGFFRGSSFGKFNIGDFLLQKLYQPPSNHGVIIRNEGADHDFIYPEDTAGTRSVIVVPFPGELTTVNSPPSKRARSFIPSRPSESPRPAVTTLNPTPLSRMRSERLPL